MWVWLEGQVTGAYRAEIDRALAGIDAGHVSEVLLDLSDVDRVDTAGLEAVGRRLPTGVGIRVVEPRAAVGSSTLLARAFPEATLHPSVAAMCAAIHVEPPALAGVAPRGKRRFGS